MSKVVILGSKLNLSEISFGKNDDIIVIGEENGLVPMPVVKKLLEGKVRLEIIDKATPTACAFLLGKLSDKEKITDIYTDNAELKALFEGSMKKPVRASRAKTVKEDAEKAEAKEVKAKKDNFSESMNPPGMYITKEEIAKKPAKKARTPKTVMPEKETFVPVAKDFKSVKEKDVKKILKDAGYSDKYVAPIMEALAVATDVSLDMYVRTKVALVEEDKEVIIKLGELIKEKLA